MPIVIGVSGHRHILPAATEKVSTALRHELEEILREHPHSPIVLLTALAEGADSLAARIGLELERVSVVAPLPMPLAEYRRDFRDPASLRDFDELLAAVDHWFELPLRLAGKPIDPADPALRSMCYSVLAEYIARYSHYAIALWDGTESRGGGSTAEFVNIVLHGIAQAGETRGSIQEPASAGPLIHIMTPRSEDPHNSEASGVVKILYPNRDRNDSEEERTYRGSIANIEQYNRDLHEQWGRIQPRLPQLADSLVCPDFLADDRQLSDLRLRFALADYLAVHFKHLHIRDLVLLLILSGIGYTGLELYDELFSASTWGNLVLLAFPIALLLAWLRLRNSRTWHVKYLNYRALAEGLRIQYYWDIASLQEEVHDYYLNKHQNELRWIRWAMQAWLIPWHKRSLEPEQPSRDELRERLHFVHRVWMFRQSSYYSNRAHAKFRDAARLDRWRMSLFIMAVGGALLLAVLHALLFGFDVQISEVSAVQSRVILVLAMLFVLGGMLSHYAEKVSYNDEQLQYHRMHDVFWEGSKQLDRLLLSAEMQRAKALIREVGIEGLQENGNWVEMHNLKSPELPSS